jgi:hypothetical protein
VIELLCYNWRFVNIWLEIWEELVGGDLPPSSSQRLTGMIIIIIIIIIIINNNINTVELV